MLASKADVLTVWGQTAPANLEMLEDAQNKILRKIADTPWFMHNGTIRTNLKVDTIRNQVLCKIE